MFLTKTWARPRSAPLSLELLKQLNGLHRCHETLEVLLQRAAELVVNWLNVEGCVITWLREDKTAMTVRACHTHAAANGALDGICQEIALTETTQSFAARSHPALAWAAGERFEGSQQSVPLRVDGKVVGFLYALFMRRRHRRDDEFNLLFFSLIGEHLGFAIEAQQMRYLLASRYASDKMSRSRQDHRAGHEGRASHMLRAAQNPEKVAQIIARSFYRDLRKAGFATPQILMVASEIISNLNDALCKTKAKADEKT